MDNDSPTVLAIDIGGSHVKIRSSAGGAERRAVSGPKMTAASMADTVGKLAQGLVFDHIAMGYPGPVMHTGFSAIRTTSPPAGSASTSPGASASRCGSSTMR